MVIHVEHERELYMFLYELAKKRGVLVRRIGGMPDHIHILCDIPPKISVSDFVKVIKSETSKFMRMNHNFPEWERWAEGYGVFTVDSSSRRSRIEYIKSQKEHHKKYSFEEEFLQFLKDADVPIDEYPKFLI